MKILCQSTALTMAVTLTASTAIANTTIGCGPKAEVVTLSIQAQAWTSVGPQFQPTCPLLEEKELLKLVEKFGAGTTFAHPAVPYTCLSGVVSGGTLVGSKIGTIEIDPATSYSESAQRLIPVPSDQGEVNVFATSTDYSLQAGAAMTVVHLEGANQDGDDYVFDLVLDDHFLLTATGEDTEDFLVVGSKGEYEVSGRLTGKGQVVSLQPLEISFEITGQVCVE